MSWLFLFSDENACNPFSVPKNLTCLFPIVNSYTKLDGFNHIMKNSARPDSNLKNPGKLRYGISPGKNYRLCCRGKSIARGLY